MSSYARFPLQPRPASVSGRVVLVCVLCCRRTQERGSVSSFPGFLSFLSPALFLIAVSFLPVPLSGWGLYMIHQHVSATRPSRCGCNRWAPIVALASSQTRWAGARAVQRALASVREGEDVPSLAFACAVVLMYGFPSTTPTGPHFLKSMWWRA